MLTRIAISLLLALTLAACATEGDLKLPGVYRIAIQQGNVVEQDMISKLKPGMDQNQVRFIMGTPVLVDPFHTDRWEYVFIYSEGGERREQRHITVHFKNQKLAYVDGDTVVAERKPVDNLKPQQAPIDVPLTDHSPGFFSRLFNALPFVGEKEPQSGEKTGAEPGVEPASPEGTETAAPAAQSAALPESGGTRNAEAEGAGSAGTNEGTESADTAPPPGPDQGAWPVEPDAPGNNVSGRPAEPLPAPGEAPPPADDTGRSGTPE